MELNSQTETQFRVYDNSFTTITLQELKNLKNELMQYGLQRHERKWQLESQIQSVTSKKKLSFISW